MFGPADTGARNEPQEQARNRLGPLHLMCRFNPHQRQAVADDLPDRGGQEQPRAANRQVFRVGEAARRVGISCVPQRMEFRGQPLKEEGDRSTTAPSGRGYFPGPPNGLDVSVKDSKRFADSNGWGYFNFNHSAPPYLATAALKSVDECAGCHIANAEDMVYIKFYKPILDPLPLPRG